jgi:hypothetical protein
MRISPAVGSTKPATMRRVVVLPQPLGPNRQTSSPLGTPMDRSSTATMRPNSLRRDFIDRTEAFMG